MKLNVKDKELLKNGYCLNCGKNFSAVGFVWCLQCSFLGRVEAEDDAESDA